jgi:hypothetical protein
MLMLLGVFDDQSAEELAKRTAAAAAEKEQAFLKWKAEKDKENRAAKVSDGEEAVGVGGGGEERGQATVLLCGSCRGATCLMVGGGWRVSAIRRSVGRRRSPSARRCWSTSRASRAHTCRRQTAATSAMKARCPTARRPLCLTLRLLVTLLSPLSRPTHTILVDSSPFHHPPRPTIVAVAVFLSSAASTGIFVVALAVASPRYRATDCCCSPPLYVSPHCRWRTTTGVVSRRRER